MMKLLATIMIWAALAPAPAQAGSVSALDIANYQALAEQDLRLATVGHRLALANAPFCARKSRNPGWVLHDKAQYPDAATAQAAFGFRLPVAVSGVVSGGAAQALGIKPGDAIIAVNNVDFTSPNLVKEKRASTRLEKLHNILGTALDKFGKAEITFMTADGEKRVKLAPPAICASRFWVDTKSKLDAGADGVSVRVTAGFMAFTADDEAQLATLVAHEMSHNLLGHRQRLAANGNSNKQILETEIEADRLSVWLMANAGYDTQAALHFMQRFGRRTDLWIFAAGTHLRWQNRQKVMLREITLIQQAIAENRPLTPPLLAPGKL
jgi:hypothetical protein